jgi:hypothetical protein
MGNNSITQRTETAKAIKAKESNWEEESYQIGCQAARQAALERLKALEEQLFEKHPGSWRVEGSRSRTLVTRFGDLTVRRRLYRDAEGGYHFLLDEYLGWPAGQLATPSLQASLVELATQTAFRSVSQTLAKLTAGVLSSGTIYQLVKKTANRALAREEADWQAMYERGELPSGEDRQVKILFTEADGTFVHLQREAQTHYEVKQAIAYEGWERLAGKEERYRLVGKRVYCQANEEMPFWEGAGLEWSRKWDLGNLQQVVIGGDGASWIDSGLGEFRGSQRQLDGFHLARACGKGWQEGAILYEAIRAGDIEQARQLMESLSPREGRGVARSRQYVKRNIEKGRDWRTHSELTGRGLGSMESNEDKLIANRMKKRGLSWTIKGALRMNKAIQLAANEQIKPFCERPQPLPERNSVSQVKVSPARKKGYQKWLEAYLPALHGPHANRPWVKHLRDVSNLSCRLN